LHAAQRSGRSHAGSTDGCGACGGHETRSKARAVGQRCASRQRRARIQQTHQNIHNPVGGVQAIPNWWQLEAFKRYRTGGEQKVTVQHVSVSDGGQAIVGNVTQNSRHQVPDRAVTAPALTHSKTQPMKMVGEPDATRFQSNASRANDP
jgi:hypothetical protein